MLNKIIMFKEDFNLIQNQDILKLMDYDNLLVVGRDVESWKDMKTSQTKNSMMITVCYDGTYRMDMFGDDGIMMVGDYSKTRYKKFLSMRSTISYIEELMNEQKTQS